MADSRGSGLVIRPIGNFLTALQQLYQAPPDTIRGISTQDWGSPLQPIKPIAPDGSEPRGFEWWMGQNLNFTPRSDSEYTAADLKALATYPLARICIENVKDQLSKAKFSIQLREDPNETKSEFKARSQADTNLDKLNDFFAYPDAEHCWADWVRPLLEDMLVIDAATILVRKTFAGEVAELRVIRGESIVRLIDNNGYTPMPPSPAYQQIWWGQPLVNLTTDQLIYRPRNIVPRNTQASQLYGMSPTEQMADEIKVGIKRLEFVLSYYTEGSVPGVIHVVPKGTPPDKISEAMQWMNSDLAGNLAARRQWRMIPGFQDEGKTDQIIFSKEPLLADTYDELHIRKIAFAYGTSPQRLMRMMGTRNADAQQEAAMEEGLLPWLNWLKTTIDYIIQRKMGFTQYEIIFNPLSEADPSKEAETQTKLVAGGIVTPNEGRDKLGLDRRKEPEADMLGVITGSGFTPITGPGALSTPAPQPEPTLPGGGGGTSTSKPGSPKKPNGAGPGSPAKPAASAKPNGNGNGKGAAKACCEGHKEKGYQDECIYCSQQEIRRLEKLSAPVDVISRVRTPLASPSKGVIGFAANAVLSSELEAPLYRSVEDAEDGEWVTINGTHVHIGADGVIDKGPASFIGSKPATLSEDSKLLEGAARGTLDALQLDRLSQEQLLDIAQRMGTIEGGVEGYKFPLAGYWEYGQIVSRMDPETAKQLVEGKDFGQKSADWQLGSAMVAFGPGSVAEEVASKLPGKYSDGSATDDAAYQKDPELGARSLISGWLLTDGTSEAIHIQELAKNMGPNAGKEFVFFHADDKNIAERTDPSPNFTSHLNDIYTSTQKYWEDQGKANKTIELYRGSEKAYSTSQPVEPWTTDRYTAMRFNGGGIMVAQVPYKAILMDYKSQSSRWVPEKDLQGKKEYTILTGGIQNMKSYTKDDFKNYKRGSAFKP